MTERRWRITTPQWPIMHVILQGISRDQFMARHHANHVNVAYADPEDQTYVSVSGTARLVKDKAKLKELWSPIYKTWFPQGLRDPDVTLLKVDVTEAEYWDSPGNVISSIMVAFALATGARVDYGEHKKVSF